MEPLDCCPRCFTWCIHQADGAKILIAAPNDHRRMTRLTKLFDGVCHWLRQWLDTVGTEHFRLANQDQLTLDSCGDPTASQTFKIGSREISKGSDMRLPVAGNRLCQWMITQTFHRDGDRHQFFFGHARRRNDLANARLATRQSAGLVKGDGIK